ncbi:MAG: NERD domain-containing protein [Nitriliruptoraceae bacterium]|nr:NERD domain-containing protein [Nitriliruptoraceae bacterium]
MRAEFYTHLSANKGRYVGFLLVWIAFVAGLAALMIVLNVAQFVVGLLVGMLLGGLPLFAHAVFLSLGLGNRSMGADAEQWTACELEKLDRRWKVFHDVPLSRSNVDHVVVGPGRVYAIESKWTARSDVERFLNGASRQAARQARELSEQLRAYGASRDVRPLLVVWGPGMATRLGEKPTAINKVPVVAGPHSEIWRERMNGALDRLEADRPAIQALTALLAAHEERLDADADIEADDRPLPDFVDPPPSTTQAAAEA